MPKKKELNEEELTKVSGGDTYHSLEKLSFLYGTGFHVEVHLFRIPVIGYQVTARGNITKKGYTKREGMYCPCYYITCDESKHSGWYDEEDLQDRTHTSWDKIDPTKTTITTVVDPLDE